MQVSYENSAAYKRLQQLFDDGVFTDLNTLLSDAVITAYGTISGVPCYAFSQNIEANGGAIDKKQCDKLLKVYELAKTTGCPIVGIYDSNGMDLKEPAEAMNGLAALVKASSRLSGVVPQISVIAGACLATAAVLANAADLVVCMKDAAYRLSILSEEYDKLGKAEDAADICAESFEECAAAVKTLLSLLPQNNLSPVPVTEYTAPQSTEYGSIEAIADEGSVIELKKQYYILQTRTALATVAGKTTGFVDFGNNGKLNYSDLVKADGFIKLCDAYSIPVVTLANADGYSLTPEAMLLESTASLTSAYAGATCPKISLITKKAVGSAYMLLAGKGANADYVLAWENAVISPLNPDSAVAFLYGERLAAGESREALEAEYAETEASASKAAQTGLVDAVIAPEQTRETLINVLDMLSGKRETTIPRKHSVK